MAADPKDFWQSFGDDSDFVEVTCDETSSLACEVLTSYGIPCSDQTGGSLKNLDVKRMDAMQVVKLSLLEESSDTGQIYEPVMNSDAQEKIDYKKRNFVGSEIQESAYCQIS